MLLFEMPHASAAIYELRGMCYGTLKFGLLPNYFLVLELAPALAVRQKITINFRRVSAPLKIDGARAATWASKQIAVVSNICK